VPAYTRTEIAVGLFVIAGVAALAYLSLSLGSAHLFQPRPLRISARFATVGDLKQGAAVKLAGVRVGQVASISLNNYQAVAELTVDSRVALPADTIASIRTSGLLGASYVLLSPGSSERDLHNGDRIAQTEPPVDLFDLLSKFVFGQGKASQ
jgi:phospholipid/cholesterol/gamma-HCH transport system substrate-binding protein